MSSFPFAGLSFFSLAADLDDDDDDNDDEEPLDEEQAQEDDGTQCHAHTDGGREVTTGPRGLRCARGLRRACLAGRARERRALLIDKDASPPSWRGLDVPEVPVR